MIRNSKQILKAVDMLSHMRECNGYILNHVHTAYNSKSIYSMFFILNNLCVLTNSEEVDNFKLHSFLICLIKI